MPILSLIISDYTIPKEARVCSTVSLQYAEIIYSHLVYLVFHSYQENVYFLNLFIRKNLTRWAIMLN